MKDSNECNLDIIVPKGRERRGEVGSEIATVGNTAPDISRAGGGRSRIAHSSGLSRPMDLTTYTSCTATTFAMW